MRQRALIGALGLVLVGVVLGATVFRSDIAQATGLAQSVTVNNTPAQAVPVREQNLDGANIKVHEQGTANVNVTNSSLSVAPPAPITTGGGDLATTCPLNKAYPSAQSASALSIHMDSGVAEVILETQSLTIPAARFAGPAAAGNASVALALSRPVAFDSIRCIGTGTFSVSWVGNQD
jgi:hypothetical protein